MTQYAPIYRDFSADSIVSAPISRLASMARPVLPLFPDAKWIYSPWYIRFHTFRLFDLAKPVRSVKAAFLCDNAMDVYLNGSPAAKAAKDTGLLDLTPFAVRGENNLHLTVYQTDDAARFVSALCGGVAIEYRDGSREEIVTDGSFRRIQLVSFWETREPEGFSTITDRGHGSEEMLVFPMHPAALRRSFWFKKSFRIDAKPSSAVLRASALGMYEAWVNGARVSDGRFMPSAMEKCREYQEFDVLPLLKEGENTLTFLTGSGWYNSESWGTLRAGIPGIAADIALSWPHGRTDAVRTDGTWLCGPSPLLEDDLQYGERYDARLERGDAFTPGGDPGFWQYAQARENRELARLVLQPYPPVRCVRTWECRFVKLLPGGCPLYDVGHEIAGRCIVTMRDLRPGQQFRIRYCERLKDDGTPENVVYGAVAYQNDCEEGGMSPGLTRNMDVYTAKGTPLETYECRFAYTGFRYIWIEGLETPDRIARLTATELHNDLTETGTFASSNEDVQWMYEAAKLSWLNNICNGPTDCPTREKNFWNGDIQIFADSACFLTDNSKLLSAWTDMGRKMGYGAYGWDDEEYCVPLTLFRFYGDKGILRAKFPAMLALAEKRAPKDEAPLPTDPIGPFFGDWLPPGVVGPSPNVSPEFFIGAWYCRTLRDTAYAARALGETAAAEDLEAKAARAREAFIEKFILPDGSDTTQKCQGAIVFALKFGLAKPSQRAPLAERLVQYVRDADWHLTTGFLSTRYLLGVLCDSGHKDAAEKLLLQRIYPSWIGIKETGATSMTEMWSGMKEPDRSMSMCHYAYGSVAGWLFEYPGGIRVEESEPGLRHVVLRPVALPGIGNMDVSLRTEHGVIRTRWRRDGDGAPRFEYELPEGVTTDVYAQ